MDNLSSVATPGAVPTKQYVDTRVEVAVGTTEPTDPLITLWVKKP